MCTHKRTCTRTHTTHGHTRVHLSFTTHPYLLRLGPPLTRTPTVLFTTVKLFAQGLRATEGQETHWNPFSEVEGLETKIFIKNLHILVPGNVYFSLHTRL